MPALSPERIGELLRAYYPQPTSDLLAQLSIYLELLLKWNSRMNLSAIRDPVEIVRRHFGESLFTARHLPECDSLLDLGSGAGFPGLPIQLALPWVRVTLAECQKKKVGFLREAIRTLNLPTEVWPSRIEEMPSDRRFDIVTFRAVDNPTDALALAKLRIHPDGLVVHLSTLHGATIPLPDSEQKGLHLIRQ